MPLIAWSAPNSRKRDGRGAEGKARTIVGLAANVPRLPYLISLRTASSPLVKLAYRLDRTVSVSSISPQTRDASSATTSANV